MKYMSKEWVDLTLKCEHAEIGGVQGDADCVICHHEDVENSYPGRAATCYPSVCPKLKK